MSQPSAPQEMSSKPFSLKRILWIFLNIPLLGLPALFVAGPMWVWENFGCYAVGSYKRDKSTGRIRWVRFVHYPDVVHSHWLAWGGLLLAGLLYLSQEWSFLSSTITPFGMSISYFVLCILTVMAIFRDTKFLEFVWLLGYLLLVVVADFGLRFVAGWGTKGLTALSTEATQPLKAILDLVTLVPATLDRGVLAPLWDAIVYINPESNVGFLVLQSLLVIYAASKPIFVAILRNRVEIDVVNLTERSFGEREAVDPVYMRTSELRFSDMFEVAAGFADLYVATARKGARVFRNIFGGAWWLRVPLEQFRNYQTVEELAEAQQREMSEDAGDLVRPADVDSQDGGDDDFAHGHGEEAHIHP